VIHVDVAPESHMSHAQRSLGEPKAEPTGLLRLSPSNFSSVLSRHSAVLVLYAAAWCSQGQTLLPSLTGAAEILATASSNAAIAICEDANLGKQAGVTDFPSLRLHLAPHLSQDAANHSSLPYIGSIEIQAVASFVLRHERTSPLTLMRAEAVRAEAASSNAVLMLFGDTLDPLVAASASSVFTTLAADPALRDLSFAIVPSSERVAFYVDPKAVHSDTPAGGDASADSKLRPPAVLLLRLVSDQRAASSSSMEQPARVSSEQAAGSAEKSGEPAPLEAALRPESLVAAAIAAETRGGYDLPNGWAAATEEVTAFDGDVSDAAALRAFVGAHELPYLGLISPKNFEAYQRAQERVGTFFWLFVNSSDPEKHNTLWVIRLIRRVAKARHKLALFGYLDGEHYSHYSRALAGGGSLPALSADVDGEHFVWTSSLLPRPFHEMDTEDDKEAAARRDEAQPERLYQEELFGPLLKWVDAVLARAIPPTMRTQDPPLDNFGPLTRLVGSTVEPLALKAKIDVLLLIYAPWCEACVALKREVEALAAMWQDERRLRVCEIDVSLNDLPRSLHVEKLPALLFIKANRKESDATIDLSALTSYGEISNAIVTHSSIALPRPVDTAELTRLLDLLPRFGEESKRLLAENQRLQVEVRSLRERLKSIS